MGVNKSKGAVDVGEKKLYVNLLGEFSVWYGDKKVYMGRISTGRQAQLFQLLMISPGFQISKEKLMADIYKSGEFNNRNNSVNNAIYRLRKMLTDAGVPGDEYIAIENGNCVWKEDIPVQVDTVEFKRLLEESRDAEDDDKLHILQEAWLLYRGPLLASNSIEEWAIPENLHYKELYRDCTNQIADILKEKERWEDLYTLYTTALGIETYEEWQLGQLDALIALGEYEKAYKTYEKAVRIYTEVSDLPVSEEMLKRSRKISQYLKGGYEDLDDIQVSFLEVAKKSEEQVYECPYPNFMDVYCSILRLGARIEVVSCLMQCTIVNRKKLPVQKAVAAKKSALLLQAIKQTLRYGDIFTQYNTSRFLIILNHTKKENGKIVFNRIAKVYEELGGNRRDIDYQITPMYQE